MPRRDDLRSILLIGSGPIVIGQACEFDYSGTQACRVLREEGYRVVLANSNPATIMTDPEFADATYVEPLDASVLEAIIAAERPDALLPTLGGQTALNLATELVAGGVLDRYGVELIGATETAIATAEDRERFKEAMTEIGLAVPRSGIARTHDEARRVAASIGLPVIIRPAYILGGKGTGFASTGEELEEVARAGLDASPIGEILIEQSIAGWKEFELEVMRDRADNCVVICSIENVDPMGVHTGDSITVAPAQTLTDVEYQRMRDAAFACIRRVGVETGGSNVQFAVHPGTGEQVVIEMNPRVSRSSALASKATGFPIAKIAARLAVGYTLDEITNDITGETPASFEPTIDYVVTKIPRWAFEKLPGAAGVLGPQMQSVGEVMAIGRTFPESLQKAVRSLEQGRSGLNGDPSERIVDAMGLDELTAAVQVATPDRLFQVEALLRRGATVDEVHRLTAIDPWFLDQILAITEERLALEGRPIADLSRRDWRRAKRRGFSDAQLAHLLGAAEPEVRARRLELGVAATFKTVDTCAAEFAAETPYHYSTYEDEDEVRRSDRPKVVILGSGPNRIGQGIEFDYCCVHASFALRAAGYETVMVNCNPETVSTDYDTSDRLYFEPLTHEDVTNVLDAERPVGVIVALGGQTPLKLAGTLPADLVLGTSPESIDEAEDRERWNSLCAQLEIPQPPGGTAATTEEAMAVCERIGFPALVRPSYVLGGRAMTIVYDTTELKAAMAELATAGSLGREGGLSAERPVLIDRFLEDAVEVDVDAIRDAAGGFMIGGIMQHVEEAGVHSGDSACAIPPPDLSADTMAVLERLHAARRRPARRRRAHQRAVRREAGPGVRPGGEPACEPDRAVRRQGHRRAAREDRRPGHGRLRPGDAARRREIPDPAPPGFVAVKEAVLPFQRFPEVDSVLGPEMRSTGEVMGIDISFGLAFAKSQMAAGGPLPDSGCVFLSLADRDKASGLVAARRFVELGFEIAATAGTAAYLTAQGVPVAVQVAKLTPGSEEPTSGADAVELIEDGRVQMVVNTPRGRGPRADGRHIRTAAVRRAVPCLTTVAAAVAAAEAMTARRGSDLVVRPLQAIHAGAEPTLPL